MQKFNQKTDFMGKKDEVTARSAETATMHNDQQEFNDGGMKMNTPTLPDSVFEKLPNILKEGCGVFAENKRERDVFFTGALVVLSASMPKLKGGYRGDEVNANLFAFIVAPAASGKGVLKYAKELGVKYDEALKTDSVAKRKEYKQQLASFYKQKKSTGQPPVEPPMRMFFLPANISSAGLIMVLQENYERGIVLETEADTMTNAISMDWGGYSDMLRKSFHHEPISYFRKGDKEFVEIRRPEFSLAQSGTPSQVAGLLKSSEDGLFSRFVFYTFDSEPEWQTVGPDYSGVNLTQHFKGMSEVVYNLIQHYNGENTYEFSLTEKQWGKLNEFGESSISRLAKEISLDLGGTAKRLGLILYRTAMVLSGVRYFEEKRKVQKVVCEDIDFDTALKVVSTYQEHAISMYESLPDYKAKNDGLKSFNELLPDKFTLKTASDINEKYLGLKSRTTYNYLKALQEKGLVKRVKQGSYEKIVKGERKK